MPKRLAVGGCIAIMMIIAMVLLVNPNGWTASVVQKNADNPWSLSNRLCPAGYYASYYQTLPIIRGGPAEQFSLKCIRNGQPIVAQHIPFTRNSRAPFDRIRQDPWVMIYNG